MPSVGSSKPPIIRRLVVLPQPGRAEEREEAPARDLERDVVDRDDVVEALRHALEAGRRRRARRSPLPLDAFLNRHLPPSRRRAGGRLG